MQIQDTTTNITKSVDKLNVVKSKIDSLLYSDISLIDNFDYLKGLVSEYKVLLDVIVDFNNKNG